MRQPRPTQFLRDAMFGLANVHRVAGETAYDWRPFGPDLREREWQFQSFDPPEALPPEKGPRFRAITWPSGMEGWREPGFDAEAAGWGTGLPPFGQLDGELVPLSSSCGADFCGCSVTPRTLWEHEVLMLRGTFEFPALRPDRRYRLVVGGSAHVAAGEGFTLAVNGKGFESRDGVGRRQGGQPRGARITQELREEFARGPVTLSIHSFLRTNTPRGPIPPAGTCRSGWRRPGSRRRRRPRTSERDGPLDWGLTPPEARYTPAQQRVAGWSSLVARRAHNPEVAGSNPAPLPLNEAGSPSGSRPRFVSAGAGSVARRRGAAARAPAAQGGAGADGGGPRFCSAGAGSVVGRRRGRAAQCPRSARRGRSGRHGLDPFRGGRICCSSPRRLLGIHGRAEVASAESRSAGRRAVA